MLNSVMRTLPSVACQVRMFSQKAPKLAKRNVIHKINAENKLLFGILLNPMTATQKVAKPRTRKSKKQDKSPDQEIPSQGQVLSLNNLKPESVVPAKPKRSYKKKTLENPKESVKEESSGFNILEVNTDNMLRFPMINSSNQIVRLPATVNLKHIPYVTRVISGTMSEESKAALERWESNLTATLGKDGFQKHKAELFLRGSQFHSIIHSHLLGKPYSVPSEIEGCWTSLSKVLPDVGKIISLESPVCHPSLQYRGAIDCLAEFREEPMIVEWKKSDRKKPFIQYTYDAPIQMVAYIGAMNFDPSYQQKVKLGTVVVAYTDGSPADVFCLNSAECDYYWKWWLIRLQEYKQKHPNPVPMQYTV
ncbi:mitochondrial genome maintenance exonuclease 1-like [Neocloeon triangulifer]|uniref:mitochondrial genome maintenance exonuclease 1-like n=1 Tax=Neocloeon triangulifer TaxID=2078957 RepID=UPI00286ED80D|nr:mitochondrial genome maintenance exonuclease 1-like [Neocloeon triangulifer]XP_059480192.1 mitochondrial genome maintenance exonuclease 1-like [Neocloeon triangulifer]